MSDTWTRRHWPTQQEREQWAREEAEQRVIRNPVARVTVRAGKITEARKIGPTPPDGEYLIVHDPAEDDHE